MEKAVQIRGLSIGTGTPKICIPIVGKNLSEISGQARRIAESKNADLVEWRADCFPDTRNPMKLLEALGVLRKELGGLPLLFTIRTAAEGGQADYSEQDYLAANRVAMTSGLIDLVDVQYAAARVWLSEFIMEAHRNQTAVVVSSHNFQATPGREQMVSLLTEMAQAGADLPKLAVMPNTPADVLNLLSATREAYDKTGRPLITMSMSKLGSISRVCGALTGSAVTFGTEGESSAPGQIPAGQLKTLLERFSLS